MGTTSGSKALRQTLPQPDPALIAMLTALPDFPWPLAACRLREIPGGEINRCFRLEVAEQTLLLKWLSAQQRVPLDRAAQFALQQQLARHGMAAEPVYLSACQQIWLEQWCEVQTFADQDPDKLSLLATALGQIHGLTINTPALDLVAHWHCYLKHLLTTEQQIFLPAIATCEAVWAQADKSVLCHHDLSFGHVLKAPAGVILDWEYAALSNRYFDLASCAAINQLSDADAQQLAANYASATGIRREDIQAGMEQMQPLVQLTNALWYAANRDKTG
ncbi:phosphotransferase [Pseudobowmanella zhangzhouensis]|uniref:phosphotransferase n=1 Tax=Pseudobowmanella zhangzhouensis TaxID=1537679 RepID=UPI003607AA50